MTKITIPFNRPTRVGNEQDYIVQAIAEGHISGDGSFTKKCSTFLEKELEVSRALLTTSCTHALEMAALLLDIQPGDEVIIPAFTFVSTANAFVLRGATPVFIDVRSDTLNMDETQLESLITPRTKAIVPVHYAGVGCEMDAIVETAVRHNLVVVEDSAQGLFGKYKGQYLGTFGALAAQSFHETKNLTCGEGGALFINDEWYIEKAEILREKGTDRSRFFRGQVDKYTWVDLGSSYLPSDILAAFLYAQLQARTSIQQRRQQMWEYYHHHLLDWANANNVQLPTIPTHCEQSYHMFYMLLPSREQRDGLIRHLKHYGIQSVFHYLPLHLSAKGKKFGGKDGDCPVTESISRRLLRLPFFNELKEIELAHVVETVRNYTKIKSFGKIDESSNNSI